jgi:hypothetical protein
MSQTSLVPLLDALLPFERVASEDEMSIRPLLRRALLVDDLPDVPDCIIVVNKIDRLGPDRILVTLVLFDGAQAMFELRLSQSTDERPGIMWFAKDEDVPFGWDPRLRRWRRYPELVGIADDHRDAFARVADEEAKAARRRLGYAKGVATRAAKRAAIAGMSHG